MDQSMCESLQKTFKKEDYDAVISARELFVNTLKTYKLYRNNIDLFGNVYIACDRCYDIRPKWSNPDYFRNHHDNVSLCKDCYHEALSDDEQTHFDQVLHTKRPNTGLFLHP